MWCIVFSLISQHVHTYLYICDNLPKCIGLALQLTITLYMDWSDKLFNRLVYQMAKLVK